MKPNAGNKIPGEVEKALKDSFGSIDKAKEDFIQGGVTQFGSGWSWLAVKGGKAQGVKTANGANTLGSGGERLRLVVACSQVWQGSGDEDAKWRKPACPRREANPRRRRVGALLLHRLSQSPSRLSQGVGRSPHQLGICRGAVWAEVSRLSRRLRPAGWRRLLFSPSD